MKLNNNEKRVLSELLVNPKITNKALAKKMKLTAQGIGKIRSGLKNKGVINNYELVLNYEKIGLRCFAFTLVKIMPKAFREYKKKIQEMLSHPNILMSIRLSQTNVTHLVLFGFRDVSEHSRYFELLQSDLPGLVEIKESFVFSNESFIKNSSAALFLKLIREFGDKRTETVEPMELI